MEVTELSSTQEEADTRVLLHVLHTTKARSKVVILTAEDTDVMVLCLGFNRDIPCSISQKCGTKNNMCKLQTCSNQKKEQFAVELGDSDDGDGDND